KSPAIAMGPGPSFGKAASTGAVATAVYKLPEVAAPVALVGHAFRSTVSPAESINNADLAKLLPAAQPFDKASVSLEAAFNGTSLREQLTLDPDGEAGPQQPIPLGWWKDAANEASTMIEIIGVEVERETLRNPDGTTPSGSTIVKVPGIPGRFNAIKMWNDSIRSLGDVPPMLDQYRSAADQILRPAYVSTIAGPAWKAPSEMAAAATSDGDAKMRRVAELKKRLGDVDEKIADLEQKIQSAPQTDGRDKPATRPEARPGEGGGGRGGGGGKGGGPSNIAPPAPTVKKEEPQLSRPALERQLATRNDERKRLVKSLAELGEKTQDAVDPAAPLPVAAEVSLLDNPEVKLYAHDLTVEPGAQYRYRMRVIVNNPLFGRNLQESQRTFADKSMVEGAWSSWTGAVDVDPNEFFFVTSAEPRSDISAAPKAAAEMYVFYYGYYRMASVSLEPGDVLTGTAKLPELKLADMKKLEESLKNPSAAPAMQAPVRTPGGKSGGGGGGKSGGGRPSEREQVDRGGRQAPIVTEAVAANVDWLSLPAKKTIELKVDAVYLDTVPLAVGQQGLAGEERPRFMALMRNQHGQLVSRLPDVERATAAYKRLEASAKEGARQNAPEVKEEEGRVRPPKVDRPSSTPQEPKKSSSGG
ncbi:MAG: hypothetical protein NTV94_07045, partial [Planctomycetota bacterium]|nr:hypothetical protein [Planctomycetota bacterium]